MTLEEIKIIIIEIYKFYGYDLTKTGYDEMIKHFPEVESTFYNSFIKNTKVDFKTEKINTILRLILVPIGYIFLGFIYFSIKHKTTKFKRKYPEYFL